MTISTRQDLITKIENEIKAFIYVRIKEHLDKPIKTDEIKNSLNNLYLLLKNLDNHIYDYERLKCIKGEFYFTQGFKDVLWFEIR